jgi:hypothetical protein
MLSIPFNDVRTTAPLKAFLCAVGLTGSLGTCTRNAGRSELGSSATASLFLQSRSRFYLYNKKDGVLQHADTKENIHKSSKGISRAAIDSAQLRDDLSRASKYVFEVVYRKNGVVARVKTTFFYSETKQDAERWVDSINMIVKRS